MNTATVTQETTAQSVTSAGLVIPAIGQPWPGQGGIYIGELPPAALRPGAHIVVSEEEAQRMEWGNYGTKVEGANSRHDGRANTQALLSTGNNHPAAAWCAQYTAEGHTDFHLPSTLELSIASALCPEVFSQADLYWASTQLSALSAFAQAFENGDSDWDFKGSEFRVRAVRWIPL